jgi:hypothetical protein
MKPVDGTFAANAEKHGVAGLWIDGGRIALEGIEHHRTPASSGLGKHGIYGKSTTDKLYQTEGCDLVRYTSKGRWPANVILDEEAAAELDRQSGTSTSPDTVTRGGKRQQAYRMAQQSDVPCYGDTGGASRCLTRSWAQVPLVSRVL